ncbi:1,6-anhydro-N-acetylmuramyl-L-alanine amidase AmpD [Halopseudomonas bauzanensis]|uniref:1,6-anhydro-N-acetylmuramyl-L-alanine amidase AmpD n=1 Tax=Halopseudomonas bauzanensis TaxID=653930 RepID=A0A1I4JZD0_9GAMM|nr:1,6-anhydro-N-acetylmuramyl-L-alanine amidase AmpD [Halopseudomonas bauzanensis]SER50053.1 AmpD protein [Halopseudomonas bauzanensis]SFL71910.1 AmpD protein [Halopseudomonas bauzanensis]
MQIDTASGWLRGIRHCPSAHFNARPEGADISLLVIHNISLPPGQFGTGCVQQFFSGTLDRQAHPYFAEIAELRVSAHFLIERDGAVTQFVSCWDRAWHAGQSCFGGRENCNDFSLGIELEGTDDEPFAEAQYASLIALTRVLQQAFPRITRTRITGHEHIAPGRKTDPGPCFDWPHYLDQLTDTAPTDEGCT